MNCPSCNATLICVLESRHTGKGVISRKRQCKICAHTWPTAEITCPPISSQAGVWGSFRVRDELVEELEATAGMYRPSFVAMARHKS
jgi:transcriptional regulator NrdR family protein